jgi:pimeloyl-ACP methyl ester carboxylesterase
MHFEKHGAGPPVVLVHGLGAYSFSWRDMVAALKQSYTTYAVDLLGFGRSPAPQGFPNTMAAQAVEVSAFIKAQNLANPILIGHSMGGGVALRVAEQAGQNGQPSLGKLVLIAPVAYPPDRSLPGGSIDDLSKLLNLPEPELAFGSRQLVEQILKKAYKKPARVTPQQIDGYAKGLSSRNQLRAFLGHSSKLSELAAPAARLLGITVETLIIWGKDDTFLPPSNGKTLEGALAHAKFKDIVDCGHIPQEEKPVETIGLVSAFLQ